jgi:YD repeat-containing protein
VDYHFHEVDSDAAGTTLVSRSEYTYDAAGRLVGLVHKNGAGSVMSSYAWQYNAVGQLVSQTDHGRTVEYTYDAQGQLDFSVEHIRDLTLQSSYYLDQEQLAIKQRPMG